MKLKPVSKKEALKDAKKFLAMVRMSVDVCANTRVREGVMTVKEMERDIRIGQAIALGEAHHAEACYMIVFRHEKVDVLQWAILQQEFKLLYDRIENRKWMDAYLKCGSAARLFEIVRLQERGKNA